MVYKLYKNTVGATSIMKIEDGVTTSFSEDPANTDYQQYLKFLEEGGQPLPADEGTQ
jgi:hypothetical protein